MQHKILPLTAKSISRLFEAVSSLKNVNIVDVELDQKYLLQSFCKLSQLIFILTKSVLTQTKTRSLANEPRALKAIACNSFISIDMVPSFSSLASLKM